ncbi:unnamed protein product, partial [Mesorhabditis spiculigera]
MEANGSGIALDTASSMPISVNWVIFVTICVLGIILNISVFWKRKSSRSKRQSSTTHISLSLLCTMAAADTICLVALFFLLSLRYWGVQSDMFFTIACKLDVFIIHAASAFSIWCWLVLSAVRYVAIYRPYTHLKMHKEPHLAVIGIAAFCCLAESWLLYDITYFPEVKACESNSDEATGQKLQIVEIIISYFLPAGIITILDLKVLFCRTVWWSGIGTNQADKQFALISNGDLAEQEAKQGHMVVSAMLLQSGRILTAKRRAQQLKVLRRCLVITVFDLGMNLPSYLYRLYLCTLTEEEMLQLDPKTQSLIEFVTQIMYFAQFSLNALYLVCIIYDTPKKRRRIPASSASYASGMSKRSVLQQKDSRTIDF